MPAGRDLTALTPARRWLFRAFTLTIPLLFFALLEAGLRLGGYGHSYPLFIPVAAAPGYLQANPEVVRRFVVEETREPEVEIWPVPFPAEKAPGTLRIVVQGGSTAAGWPYGYGGSLAGMLQQRLQASLPQRNIEVITTAMTAVNSYTLMDFADEIIQQQPDAVLIYAGHNEYLGVLGVGSAVSAGRTRPVVLAYLALRDLRVLQLLKRTYLNLATSGTSGDVRPDSGPTLMHRIVAESHIAFDSPLYHRGEAQFRDNLSVLLERYRNARIPVFIGTLASNEKDLAPFASALAPGTDVAAWRSNFETGVKALRDGDTELATTALDAALALDNSAAALHFARGRLFENEGDYAAARVAYLEARDRDQLRFRAPQSFNHVIRTVAAEQGAQVVEVEAGLLDRADHGIIGNELMLEHLHPNLEGYFLLADAYYRALLDSGITGPVVREVQREQAWNELPVTPVDLKKADYEIMRLTADWPFRKTRTRPGYPARHGEIEQLAYSLFRRETSWTNATEQLQAYYLQQQDALAAARVAVLLADTYPYDTERQYQAGQLAQDAGLAQDAERLLRRTLQPVPD
jgi:tetratricopeptide (TPR) repeat protein